MYVNIHVNIHICTYICKGSDDVAGGGPGCRTSSAGAAQGDDAGVSSVGEGEAVETAKEEGRTLSQTQQLVTVTCGEEGAEHVSSQDLPGSVS